MIGELSLSEIENLLHTETIARIGCHSNGHTYVVPVTYAYDGEAILGYSPEGLKLTIMRENPRVCVEVDHIDSPAAWRCVIAQGTFQELSGADAEEAMRRISARFASQEASGGATLSHGLDPHAKALGRVRFFAYRITLETKTGRFEKNDPIDTLTPPS
ncbi:MAG TPA: pyridoxamine 5'-phosphate oxidase family protein [Hyphomicrobiales bacterium]|nr:pyridoxamine 5'-phosphate oxidase family protein [Hyphomicrobiales bacterium]